MDHLTIVAGNGKSSDRVRIVVVAAAAHPDVLSVQDAMRQVLDFFELLTPEDDDDFVWNLKLASTNSPLTVEGEPYHRKPDVNAQSIAAKQRYIVESSFRSLSQGRRPAERISAKRKDLIRRILRRNMNGIGTTEAVLAQDHAPIFVTPGIAEVSERALAEEEKTDFESLLLKSRARNEYGTIEGTLLEVGVDYQRPAVLVEERKTKQEVWCRVSADVRERISSETTLNDVWGRSRVSVSGRIRYAADGTFVRVWAHDLKLVKPLELNLEIIVDTDFTSGMSTVDYIEFLRGDGLD